MVSISFNLQSIFVIKDLSHSLPLTYYHTHCHCNVQHGENNLNARVIEHPAGLAKLSSLFHFVLAVVQL